MTHCGLCFSSILQRLRVHAVRFLSGEEATSVAARSKAKGVDGSASPGKDPQ